MINCTLIKTREKKINIPEKKKLIHGNSPISSLHRCCKMNTTTTMQRESL